MRINQFFAERLGAPFHNPVQSWGAVNRARNQVFFRVNTHWIDDYSDGRRWAVLLDPEGQVWSTRWGGKERLDQLKLIRKGAAAYAVVVEQNNAGKLDWFDAEKILRIGKIVIEDGTTYGEIVGEVSVEELVSSVEDYDSVESDIAAIPPDIPETVRQALINARKGQGKFRRDLLDIWGSRCAVTGSATNAAIRASHIKPWKDSTNEERLDPRNGLPLIATLDALFDKGLITFNSDAKMCVSSKLSKSEQELLGLSSLRLTKKLHPKTQEFLSFHFKNRFQP